MASKIYDPRTDAVMVAKALLSLAQSAGIPDSYMQTDRRVRLARSVIARYQDAPWKKRGTKGGGA